jgi:hypothetical protein
MWQLPFDPPCAASQYITHWLICVVWNWRGVNEFQTRIGYTGRSYKTRGKIRNACSFVALFRPDVISTFHNIYPQQLFSQVWRGDRFHSIYVSCILRFDVNLLQHYIYCCRNNEQHRHDTALTCNLLSPYFEKSIRPCREKFQAEAADYKNHTANLTSFSEFSLWALLTNWTNFGFCFI